MSQENVELILGLLPAPDADLVQLFSDESLWTELTKAVAPVYHENFECVMHLIDSELVTYTGFAAFRSAWLDWLAPWTTYRVEIDEAIDAGENVLLLARDYARRELGAAEVEFRPASIWTVRDGLIARAEFYSDRAEALKAVGLEA